MTIAEFIPIYVFITIAIFAITFAVIYSIRNRYVGLGKNQDFLEKIVEKKKRELDSNIGGMSFKMYVALMVIIPIIVTLTIWFFINRPVAAVIAGLLSVSIPELVIRFTATKQKQNFEERYARALKSLSSSLESGLSVQQAVEEIIENPFIHESIKRGFRQINSDIKIGLTVPQAFKRFAEDNKSEDAMDVAAAIAMQSEVGGSESTVIETIANNIKDRIMLRKEIKTLFADTTMMVRAMDILPYLVVLVMYFFTPTLIEPFFETVPRTVIFFGLIGIMILGSFYIHARLNAAKGGKL